MVTATDFSLKKIKEKKGLSYKVFQNIKRNENKKDKKKKKNFSGKKIS